MGKFLSRRAASLFLQLLERYDHLVLSRVLLRYRELVKEMVDCGVLAFETHASEIMVDVTDGQESVEVEADRVAGVARYRCPESGREISIPLVEVELYRLNPQRLCEALSDQLGIPTLYRDQLSRPLVADHLWFLGNANFGGANLPVFFARSLARHLAVVIEKLKGGPNVRGGLLLYSGKEPSLAVELPGRHFTVSLNQAFASDQIDAKLNRHFLECIVSGKSAEHSEPIFHFDEGKGELTIRGRKKRFIGKQQSTIAWFWKRRDSDATGFEWNEVQKDTHANSDSLANAMGGVKNRNEWFQQVSHGYYRLRRD